MEESLLSLARVPSRTWLCPEDGLLPPLPITIAAQLTTTPDHHRKLCIPCKQLTLALAHVQFGCVVLTETLALLHVGPGKHCSKCTTAMCCLQLRSQATFQTAPQLFALISTEFTCSALQNTCFFSAGLSFLPSLQGTKEAYHQKKTDMDISSLPNLLEAMQTTALTLEAVKTKSHLISFPAWVSD